MEGGPLRIAYIVACPDTPIFSDEHPNPIAAMLRTWVDGGNDVRVYCTNPGVAAPDDLAHIPIFHVPVGHAQTSIESEYARRVRVAAREREIGHAVRRLSAAVLADGADVIYERFSLFSVAMAVVASSLQVPGYLEVTGPIIDDKFERGDLIDVGAARAQFRAQLRSATQVIAATEVLGHWCAEAGVPDLAERIVVLPEQLVREPVRVVA